MCGTVVKDHDDSLERPRRPTQLDFRLRGLYEALLAG
jgi:hypothetical protein